VAKTSMALKPFSLELTVLSVLVTKLLEISNLALENPTTPERPSTFRRVK